MSPQPEEIRDLWIPLAIVLLLGAVVLFQIYFDKQTPSRWDILEGDPAGVFPAASPVVVTGLGIIQGLPLRLKMADGWCTPKANEGGAVPVLTTNKEVNMLILSRRVEQVICIGDDIEVMVTKIGQNSVRIGIKAPKHINIARKELLTESEAVEDSDCD